MIRKGGRLFNLLALGLGIVGLAARADDGDRSADEEARIRLEAKGVTVRIDKMTGRAGGILMPPTAEATDAEMKVVAGLDGWKSVMLGGNLVTDATLGYFEGKPRLATLWIGGTHTDAQGETRLGGVLFTDAGLAHLEGLKGLTRLILAGPKFTDAGLVHVRGLTGLKSLTLGEESGYTAAALDALKGLANLEELYLGGPAFDDASLAKLKMFPKLRTLTLASTRAGGAGLAALDALPDLKSLMFYHNPVEDAGYAQLETMTRLDQLSIIETPISDERVRKLKVALPKTEIAHGAIVFTGVLSR